MKVVIQSMKLNIFALKTEYDCNDTYEEEHMMFDLLELCESRNTSLCKDGKFDEFLFENCVDLKKGMICSVSKENSKIGDHDVVRYVQTIKSKDSNVNFRTYFTLTNDTFTHNYTLKGDASEKREVVCTKSELNYTQSYSPDILKVDIEGDNLHRLYNDSILYFRPKGQVVISQGTLFRYRLNEDHHISELTSNKTKMEFRLFKWFETNAGELADTRLRTYEYICNNVSTSNENTCISEILNGGLESNTIDFAMNFRLGASGLLPYDAFVYDPDIRVVFHGINKATIIDQDEVKKLKLAYFIAPAVVVVVVAIVIVSIVVFMKRKKNRRGVNNPMKMSKNSEVVVEVTETSNDDSNKWVVGKVSDDAL